MYKKPDYYADRAKKSGYPARSVYKLEEIDKKFGICRAGRSVLDIGAAPGSWSLYCLRKMGKNASITAVDLKEIENGELQKARNVRLLRGDITGEAVREQIAGRAPFDLIVCDAAPDTTGNRTVDCGRSFTLVTNIVTMFLPFLRKGGVFVVKVFQGGGETEILDLLRPSFSKVKGLKPKASRDNSFEIFYIAAGKISSSSA